MKIRLQLNGSVSVARLLSLVLLLASGCAGSPKPTVILTYNALVIYNDGISVAVTTKTEPAFENGMLVLVTSEGAKSYHPMTNVRVVTWLEVPKDDRHLALK